MKKAKKIEVYGVPSETDGILRPFGIQIMEDGERVPRLQEFTFHVNVNGLPYVKMVQLPESIEIDLEMVDVVKEVKNLRIFNDCKQIMELMDYDFRLAGRDKGESWKTTPVGFLKEKLAKCYNNFHEVYHQALKGERSMADITVFATKLANYAVILAQRNEETREKSNAGDQDTQQG